MSGLKIAPIKLRQANEYIERVHRHHGATRGMQFAVAVVDEHGEIHGVGVAGRPVSRVRQAEGYLEVTRVATDGSKNACSMIYGSLARAGQALGYPRHRIQTYILESETGASLRAAGWVHDGAAGGGSWSRDGRPREDRAPTEAKVRYLAGPKPGGSGS